MRRRGFLGALAALVAAPWLPKRVPVQLTTLPDFCLDNDRFRRMYLHEHWLLDRLDRQQRLVVTLPRRHGKSWWIGRDVTVQGL